MKTKTGNVPNNSEMFVRCEVLMPHIRNINGQTMMFEPMFSGIVTLPNNEDTNRAIQAGYLKVFTKSYPTNNCL